MMQPNSRPAIETLRSFPFLDGLSDDQLGLLAASLNVQYAQGGKRIIQRDSTDNFTYLLLKGRLELEAADGRTMTMEAGTESARRPISVLMPRQYNVVAMGPVHYLKIDNMLLQDLQSGAATVVDSEMVAYEELDEDGATENLLISEISADLAADRLILPSLPDVAIRIGRALEEEENNAKRIARLIQADPAIAAKLIKAANSAIFHGREPVNNVAAAVVRLGISTTHKLVLSFALGELFRARSPMLQDRMKALWEHSTKVAAISLVLARLTKLFDRDLAMLAGLIHDIGAVAVLSYAERMPAVANNAEMLDQATRAVRGSVGAMILRKWNFTPELVTVAEEAENWERDPSPEPDYADLVLVSQLHSFVGTPMIDQVPYIGALPCFKKLNLGEISPKLSLIILDKAESQLQKAKAMLRI